MNAGHIIFFFGQCSMSDGYFEPCKIEHFTIIVSGFYLFTIVAKSPILTVVGFLDQTLHCNKFAL